MMSVEAEILTVDDLAKLFGCDKETAAARLTSGDLPGVKVGRGWIIPRQALFMRLNEKALEESAIRRAQLDGKREEGKRRGFSENRASENAITKSTLLFLPQGNKQPGRKRRIPPPLPNLPSLK